MSTNFRLILNGRSSVGWCAKKTNPSAKIYAFRSWGKLQWTGDGVNLRATKAEAFADLGREAVTA